MSKLCQTHRSLHEFTEMSGCVLPLKKQFPGSEHMKRVIYAAWNLFAIVDFLIFKISAGWFSGLIPDRPGHTGAGSDLYQIQSHAEVRQQVAQW